MSLLIDVELNKFVEYLRSNRGFYWVQTTKAYILIKPIENNQIIRTAFMKPKSDDILGAEEEQTFIFRWIQRDGATHVLDFYIDGINIIDLAPKPQETVTGNEAIREVSKVE